MNKLKIPAGLCAAALFSTALGSAIALLGGCEYVCSDSTESSTSTSSESEAAPAAATTEKTAFESEAELDMGIDPALDGDADMMLVQIAPMDSSQSSR